MYTAVDAPLATESNLNQAASRDRTGPSEEGYGDESAVKTPQRGTQHALAYLAIQADIL